MAILVADRNLRLIDSDGVAGASNWLWGIVAIYPQRFDADNWRPVPEVLTYLCLNYLFWIEHDEDHSLGDKTKLSKKGLSIYFHLRNYADF